MVLIGSSASVALIITFNLLYKFYGGRKLMKYISNIGQYTLAVYILQSYILNSDTLGRFVNFDKVNGLISHYIIFPILSILLLYFLVAIIKLTIKNRNAGRILWGY